MGNLKNDGSMKLLDLRFGAPFLEDEEGRLIHRWPFRMILRLSSRGGVRDRCISSNKLLGSTRIRGPGELGASTP